MGMSLYLGGAEHVFDEDAVAHGGVVDEDVSDGAQQLAIWMGYWETFNTTLPMCWLRAMIAWASSACSMGRTL